VRHDHVALGDDTLDVEAQLGELLYEACDELDERLSTNVKTKADRGRARTGRKPVSPPRRPRSRARGVRRASHGSAISL
jgi:hypothetical protein